MLNLKALKIQSRDDLSPQELAAQQWEYPDAKYRVIVVCDSKYKYLYTSSIALCTGPGAAKKLTEEQLASDIAASLMKKNQLIYGQDNGDADFKGDVVFYGGGARSAAMILDIALGAKKSAAVKYWVATGVDAFETNKQLNRMFHALQEKHKIEMGIGTLEKVAIMDNGKLKLSFGAPSKRAADDYDNLTGQEIICDQFVVSIGQVPLQLTQGLSGFISVCDEDGIPIGTASSDYSIIAFGAAGASGLGLTGEELQEHLQRVNDHARTLPFEANAAVGIYRSAWTIQKIAKLLQDRGVLPKPTTNIHDYDTPDINIMSLNELTSFILNTGKVQQKDLAQEFAKEIINLRTQKIDPAIHIPPGIQNLEQLEGILPHDLARVFFDKFWCTMDRGDDNISALPPRNQNLRFFANISTEETPDSSALVSIQEHKEEQEELPTEKGQEEAHKSIYVRSNKASG